METFLAAEVEAADAVVTVGGDLVCRDLGTVFFHELLLFFRRVFLEQPLGAFEEALRGEFGIPRWLRLVEGVAAEFRLLVLFRKLDDFDVHAAQKLAHGSLLRAISRISQRREDSADV